MRECLLNSYFRVVKWLGNTRIAQALEHSRTDATPEQSEAQTDADAHAKHLGDKYRGWGISLVVLILAGAWFEVGLRAVTEDGHPLDAIGTKVVRFMIVLVSSASIWWSWKTRLRDRWIDARNRYESQRISILSEPPLDGHEQDWLTRVRQLMIEQLKYHLEKSQQFESMKRAGALAATIGGVCLLIVSLLELSGGLEIFWASFKIVLACCGFVLAGNGFLGVGALADQHRNMRDVLTNLLARWEGASETEQKKAIASELMGAMSAQESNWKRLASTLEFSQGA